MNRKLLNKAGDTIFKLASYWNKPPKGYFVSYKEFVNLSLGFGMLSFLSVMVAMATMDVSKDMMYFFNVTGGQVWIFAMVSAVIGILRAPILSMIIDNSKFKSGKFKPFILPAALLTILFFMPIPFIPTAWNDIVLIPMNIPALPFLGLLEASTVNLTLSVTLIMVCIIMGTTFLTLLTQALTGIEQTITPVSQERSNIAAFRGLICNIPSSIVNMIPSVLLMFGAFDLIKVGSGNTAIYPLTMNKIIFPIVAILSLALVVFVLKGTHERIVMSKAHNTKVKFLQGVKRLTTNKYFWIVTIYGIFVGLRIMSNVVDWVRQFCFPNSGGIAGFVDFFKTTLLMNALVVGMLTGPMLIKKFSKRKVLLVSNTGLIIATGIQLLCYNSPGMILFLAFVQNVFIGYDFISMTMTSDPLDYEQYLSQKRLEGFWQNYNALIVTIIGVFTAAISPLILVWGGIPTSAPIADFMTNEDIRKNVFFYRALIGFIASCGALIPILFYDLTSHKHASLMKALRLREAVENLRNGILTSQNIVNVKEIVDEANKYDDKFILGELSDYPEIDKILAQYDDAIINLDEQLIKDTAEDFARNIDLENKKLANSIKNAKTKAIKAGLTFDEEQFATTFIYKSKHLIKLEENTAILAQKELDSNQRKDTALQVGAAKEKGQLASAKVRASAKANFVESEFETAFIKKSYYLIQLPENSAIKDAFDEEHSAIKAEKARKADERKIEEIKKSTKDLLKLRAKAIRKKEKAMSKV